MENHSKRNRAPGIFIVLLLVITTLISLTGCANASLKNSSIALESSDPAKVKVAEQQIIAIYKDQKNRERYDALKIITQKAPEHPALSQELDAIMEGLIAKMDPSKPSDWGEKNVDDNLYVRAQILTICDVLPMTTYKEKIEAMLKDMKKGGEKKNLGKIAVFSTNSGKLTDLSELHISYMTFYPMPKEHRLSIQNMGAADTAVVLEETEMGIGMYDDGVSSASTTVCNIKIFDLSSGELIAEDKVGGGSAPGTVKAGTGSISAKGAPDTSIMACILSYSK